MKKLLVATCLTLLMTASAWASDIAVSSFTISNSHNYSGTIRLRVFYTGCSGTNFLDSLGNIVMCGTATSNFYKEVTVTVSGGSLIIPSFVIPSTDDSSRPIVTANAKFFINNAVKDFLFTNWVITNTLGASVTYAQLYNYQPNALPSSLPSSYLTAPEVSGLINTAVGTLNDASDVVKGRTKLNVAPQSPTFPVAVSTNWGRLNSLAVDVSEYGDNLNNAVTNLGSVTQVTLAISRATTVTANVTVPANIALDFKNGGYLDAGAGTWTVTIQGPVRATPTKIFYAFTAGQGTISLTVSPVYPEWWGAKGDGVTDDTAPIQAAINTVAANRGGVIQFDLKTYIIAGTLQDVSFSNSQLVLPKVGPGALPMIGIRFIGSVMPPTAAPTDTDKLTILKSTLASGNGAMIGVRANNGSGTASQNEVAHNAMSWISFQAENMVFRMPANPTNSALDLRFIPDVLLENVRIDVGGLGLTVVGGLITGLVVTEPTTSTSYGVMLPIDFIPNSVMLKNVEVMGYYNGIRWGELVNANDITIAATKVAIDLRGAQHASTAQKILCVGNTRIIKASGHDSYFASGTDTNQLTIQQLDWEDNGSLAWAAPVNTIDDANNWLYGDITYAYGGQSVPGGVALIRNGGANLRLHQTNKPWHLYRPTTNITGSDLDTSDDATIEIYRGLPTSDGTKTAWLMLTSKQSGTNSPLGFITFNNDAIANGTRKILGQIDVVTDGAIDAGRVNISTGSGGVTTNWAYWDHYGNFGNTKMILSTEGPALTIASNTIAPTYRYHTVGAGLIKTITLPPGPGAGVVHEVVIIPTAAFTYDGTGNILVAAGSAATAVINKPMIATWIPSLSKFVMSY